MQGKGELAGKVLFVAGVGPLMGSATALIAAREGAKLALAARGTEHPEAIARQIRETGGEAIALSCDLADRASIDEAVREAGAALGTIDRVFYNAGYYDNEHSSIDVDEDEWRVTMDVNYNGAHWLARAVMPGMLEKGDGAFVFNSSAASLVAGQVRFGYQVSKAGLNALTRFIAANYGRRAFAPTPPCPLSSAARSEG